MHTQRAHAGACAARPRSVLGVRAPARSLASSSDGSSGWTRSRPCSPLLLAPIRQPMQLARVATGGSGSGGDDDLSAAFNRELSARQSADAAASEAVAAKEFDGQALLVLLRQKWGRSYDVSLVQRTYLGKLFVALNIMWKYAEQKSFGYTEEEHMQRLEYVAAALRSWGMVSVATSQIEASRERPRVGKAVSIMLDVPAGQVDEWLR